VFIAVPDVSIEIPRQKRNKKERRKEERRKEGRKEREPRRQKLVC